MKILLGLVLMAILCVGGRGQAVVPQFANEALTKQERIRGLLTIHEIAKQHFAWFDRVPHVNWDNAFVEYLPLVEPDQRVHDYYRVLQRFTALLQDGHTSVQLPEKLQGSLDLLPFRLDYVEHQWVVVQRYPVAEVLQEDVPLGTVLTLIEGMSPTAFFQERVYPYVPAGNERQKRSSVNWAARFPRNTGISVQLRYPDRTLRRRLLRANRSTVSWSDELKQKFVPLEEQSSFSVRCLKNDRLVIRHPRCDSESEDQFLKLIEARSGRWPSALILDLRDNPGGDTPQRLLAHLISQPTKMWQRRTRCSISELDAQLLAARSNRASDKSVADAINNGIERGVLPKGYSPGWLSSDEILEPAAIHYDGPLYVLVNGDTGSAAEDVAAMLQGCKRATIVGTPTAGSTGNSIHLTLPGGGGARICAVQVKYADGRDFLPMGVRPDVLVRRTIQAIVEGRDEAMEVALEIAEPDVSRPFQGVTSPATNAPNREQARDRIVHLEIGIIRDVPQVTRLCDSLDLRKEKVAVGDCTLYCEQEGEGIPVVLVNGGPGGTHHCFHPHFSRAKEFAQIIYYDQRGCGLSEYAPGKGYTVAQAVDDLEQLRKALGLESWVVLGYSYGGLLAQCYALKYPERLRGLVLLCASTGLHGPWEVSRQQTFISPDEQKKIEEIRSTPGLSPAQLLFNIKLNGDWKRQWYYRPTREEMAQQALYEWIHDPTFPATIHDSESEVDLEGLFTRCPVPTLIVEGRWDMTWGADKPRRLHENHPDARMIMLEESAHHPFSEQPERFLAEVKRFVQKLPNVSRTALDAWKADVAARHQSLADGGIAEGPMGSGEKEAIAEFVRLRDRILQGERFEDPSTPLRALLSLLSACEARDLDAVRRVRVLGDKAAKARFDFDAWRRKLSQLEVFRAPPATGPARDGDIWVIYIQAPGERRLDDAYFFMHWQQRWMHCGNLGGPAVARRWHRLAHDLKKHYLPILQQTQP